MYEEADSTKLRKKKEEKKGKVLLRYHRQTKFPYNYHFFLLFCVCGWFIFFGGVGDWQSVKLMDSQSSGSYTIMFICKRNKKKLRTDTTTY